MIMCVVSVCACTGSVPSVCLCTACRLCLCARRAVRVSVQGAVRVSVCAACCPSVYMYRQHAIPSSVFPAETRGTV